MLVASLQMLKDQPEDDPYFFAAAYSLNDLFEKGAVAFDGNKVSIRDFGVYYQIQNAAAKEVLALYEDPTMTERKAAQWIARRAKPNAQVMELLSFVKRSEASGS